MTAGTTDGIGPSRPDQPLAAPMTDAIPLNTGDPTIDAWRTRAERDERAPGLVQVHRGVLSFGWQGVATFLHCPLAFTPADLRAAGVDVAFLGASLDMSTGMRGAALGPRFVRCWDDPLLGAGLEMPNTATMVNPHRELVMADYGDAPVDPLSTERSIGPIRQLVREVAETGTIPFIVGGDHSLMYPDVAAVSDVYGKGRVGVVHFDAHWDAAGVGLGHHISHGRPIRLLVEEGHVPGHNFIQVGLRGYLPDGDDLAWMREHGLRYHFMAEVEQRGWAAVMARAIEEALDGPEYMYLTIDIDVLDPAYAAGVGTPEPGGLTPRELFPLIRNLCARTRVVGVEVVEMNPVLDPTYRTAQVVNRIMREAVTGIAMYKKGLRQPDYLSPLTAAHP